MGKYVLTTGNEAESDCVSCGAGKYSDLMGMSSCTLCPAGTYLTSQGNDAASDCVACGVQVLDDSGGHGSKLMRGLRDGQVCLDDG